MIKWRFTDKTNEDEDIYLKYNKETDSYEEYKPYAIVHCETKEDFERMQQSLKECGGDTNRWISVKDKLPDIEYEVLIQLNWDDMNIVMGMYTNDGWKSYEASFKDDEVLYWMPLPKPYIEKKKTEPTIGYRIQKAADVLRKSLTQFE